MPLRDFNPKLSDEAREAVSAAFDAIVECHDEAAASREKDEKKVRAALNQPFRSGCRGAERAQRKRARSPAG